MTNPYPPQPHPPMPQPGYGYGPVQPPPYPLPSYPPQAYPPPVYVSNVLGGAGYGPRDSMTTYRRPVNHVLHGILTLMTGGLWGIVWLCVVLSRRSHGTNVETRYR